jgi:hypothetical protein
VSPGAVPVAARPLVALRVGMARSSSFDVGHA